MSDTGHAGDSLRSMSWKRRLGLLAGAVAVVGLCLAVRLYSGPDSASAQSPFSNSRAAASAKGAAPSATAAVPTEPRKPDVLAVVNNERVTRRDLAQECLWHYGEDVLDSLVNKALIADYCREHRIDVSDEEVKAEIDRMAERFGVPTDHWLNMLQKERGIGPAQYAQDIIWPTLALRKIAQTRLVVSPGELQEAYETQFGPAVQTRLIACKDLNKARRVRAAALANPDDFGNLAKEYSDDTNSAAAKGLIQPIRRHVGDPKVEQVAFSLQPGEISELVAVGDQYVILKCERLLPARNVPMTQVQQVLEDAIRDKKLRMISGQVMQQLQERSQVEIVFGDDARTRQQPGIAARVNGRVITIEQLADECIERHGREVIEGTISRRLLEQACRQRNLTVTDDDIRAEIARAALSMNKTKGPDGEPDIDAWLKEMTEEQGVSVELYVHDAVWPSVALKKLVGGTVEVTEDDLQKGYEANYGPRVRCRAIVLNNLRRAQECWEKARQNTTTEHFGDLAEQYSIEANSSILRGEVPPIQRHGGQPQLEQEAFSLQPGELSGIVQVGDKYVILFCEGYTRPTQVDFAEVRELIREDVHEKKLRIAMAQEFNRLYDAAQIDNYLTGASQSSTRGKSIQEAASTPPAAVPPAAAATRGPTR